MRPHYPVLVLLTIVAITGSVLISCKEDEPLQPHIPSIQLTVEDVSCTEAWLKVSLTDSAEPRSVAIQQDGQRVLAAQLATPESVFVIEGLLPRHNYLFVAQRLRDSNVIVASTSAQTTTMDTTTHNFTWEIDTLGDGNSSTLYDVAIINDTLAYAVGEIYLRDSTGQLDPILYNVAKWNGQKWSMMRLKSNCRLYYPNCGPETLLISPGGAVLAFGPNDIWIVAGGLHHFDGARWAEHRAIVEIGSANRIWGSGPNRLWFVGDQGLIIHWNGSIWQRVESGTTIPLTDVWGGSNRVAGKDIVLVTGSDDFTLSERKILRVASNGTVDSLRWGTIYRIPESIWFDHREVFVCGSTFWKLTHDGGWKELTSPSFFLNCIRGTAANDLMMVGHFGAVLHFNGWSVHTYNETRLSTGNYKSVALTPHRVIAVGRSGPTAVALLGRR